MNRLILILPLFLIFIIHNTAISQIMVGGKKVKIENYTTIKHLDSLRLQFGRKKDIPADFEMQILLALSHYPELANVKITFIKKKAFTPLSALPSITSMSNPFGERAYRIIISTKSVPEMERILLKNLPLNAQIGVLGHEIAHVLDYHKKSFTDLIAVAINYSVNPVYHAWFEKTTDLRTIDHELGWELYSYSKYVRTIFGSEEREVNLSDDFYLHFNEILLEMQKSAKYDVYFQPNSINKLE